MEAVRAAVVAGLVGVLGMMVLSAEVVKGVVGLVGMGVWVVGEVYVHVVVVVLATRIGVGAAEGVMLWMWRFGVEVGVGLWVYWTGFLLEYWNVIFGVWAAWVVVGFLGMADWEEIWDGTLEWFLLSWAEMVYLAGDVVRDMAKGVRVIAGW